MKDILLRIEDEILPIASEMNLEIYDILYVKEGGYNYLQIFIENKKTATTLDDCFNLSSKITDIVDKHINEKYFLEVSSPGIEKKLRKKKHFESVLEKEIFVRTKSNIHNSRKFSGILKSANDTHILLHDNTLNIDVEIDYEKIKDSKLIFEIELEE